MEFTAKDRFDHINIANMSGPLIMNHVSFGIGVAAYAFNIGFGTPSIAASANVIDFEIESCEECGSE